LEKCVILAALLQPASAPGGPVQEIHNINGEILDYIKLLVILAGILILAWVGLRHWLPKLSGMRGLDAGPIRIMARMPLEPRKTLYIVKAGDQYMLLGASDTQVSFLKELPAESIEAILARPAPTAPAPGGFSQLLARLRNKGGRG
jgi:flagellar protein FliO/FliZ